MKYYVLNKDKQIILNTFSKTVNIKSIPNRIKPTNICAKMLNTVCKYFLWIFTKKLFLKTIYSKKTTYNMHNVY